MKNQAVRITLALLVCFLCSGFSLRPPSRPDSQMHLSKPERTWPTAVSLCPP